jgi:amino acid transporter
VLVQVADVAVYQFGFIANMMLRKRPDIRRRLQRDAIKLIVIGRVSFCFFFVFV